MVAETQRVSVEIPSARRTCHERSMPSSAVTVCSTLDGADEGGISQLAENAMRLAEISGDPARSVSFWLEVYVDHPCP
jgi:hypothetical protein